MAFISLLLSILTLQACQHFHKARWALARGELLQNGDKTGFKRAAEQLAFCFHKPGKGNGVPKDLNVHELDDRNLGLNATKAAELKRRGCRFIVKGRGLDDLSRKFIASIRKYTMVRCSLL